MSTNKELVKELKIVLASTFALYSKTHQFHFNVEGPYFPQLHKLFDTQYKDMWKSVDDIGEKIRMVGGYAPLAPERIMQLSAIKSELKVPAYDVMVDMLLNDNVQMDTVCMNAFKAAEAVNNQAIMNFMAERMDAHQKNAWMLRATAKDFPKKLEPQLPTTPPVLD